MATRVIVYDERIAAAFLPGGSIAENVSRIGRYNKEAAHHFVPVRTGTTKSSIYFAVYPSGKLHFSYVVGTKVSYAIYVLAGTTGPIMPSKNMYLWVRPSPYSWYAFNRQKGTGGRTKRISVAGQKQNDWLGKSLYVTMKKHGL